jgi:hypothetical protein
MVCRANVLSLQAGCSSPRHVSVTNNYTDLVVQRIVLHFVPRQAICAKPCSDKVTAAAAAAAAASCCTQTHTARSLTATDCTIRFLRLGKV